MVIDTHCHAGAGDGLTGPWDTEAPLSGYLRRADAAGITKTVILAPFHRDYASANAQTARLLAEHRGRLI
ncbi:MAG TPA: amidohydrolase, partial [Candidatus Dormibacteraeota bacterium]